MGHMCRHMLYPHKSSTTSHCTFCEWQAKRLFVHACSIWGHHLYLFTYLSFVSALGTRLNLDPFVRSSLVGTFCDGAASLPSIHPPPFLGADPWGKPSMGHGGLDKDPTGRLKGGPLQSICFNRSIS